MSVDQLIVGGGIANTFLKASGYPIGKSLCEEDLVETARGLRESARERGGDIPVPTDVVCAKDFSEGAVAEAKSADAVAADDLILDIGPQTAQAFAALLRDAGTIVWNGPVGVFEFPQFAAGTEVLARAIADSPAFSIAGGGDTLAAVDKIRHRRAAFLHFHRRRRVSGISRRQDAARGGRTRGTLQNQ